MVEGETQVTVGEFQPRRRLIDMRGSDIAPTIRRIAGGARLIGLGWMLTLVLVALLRGDLDQPQYGWWLVGLSAFWLAISVVDQFRRREIDPVWITLGDTALAGFALVAPELAGTDDLFYGGFPGVAVAAAAAARRSRGWLVAGVLSLVTVARFQIADVGDVLARLSALVTYGMLAVIVGWAVHVLYRTDEARRVAEDARARAEERASVAAHLHDSVLQTLALVQREAQDPTRVSRLARRQETELRSWLYGGTASEKTGLAGALAAAAQEVEAGYGIKVEVVTVGDTPLNESGRALIAAGREGMINAAKHSGVDQVDVFLEVGEKLRLFVRDRGVGFDRTLVGADRAGIRDSIERRLQQIGGTVAWSTTDGTELRLEAPL
jgi:signal transduction histidine kinase